MKPATPKTELSPLTNPKKQFPEVPMNTTVARYTLARLAQLGIDRIFGVPGDYAFSINDAAEEVPGLSWVACANELNAAYAADGYARIRGAAILCTTYGVGELSAINGVMGSKAHRLPVFHLVGMPSERIQHLGLTTHHNLGDTVYDRFQSLSGAACCVSAVLTPDNCILELERVIREALRQSMPAYIVISEVHGIMPVIGEPVTGKPLSTIKRQQSNPAELDAAVETILARLSSARNPVAIVTHLVSRYGARDRAMEFVGKSNLPTAVTPMDKGTIDESLPQYIGLYNGAMSSSPAVVDAVQGADLLLDIGGMVTAELNTGFWSAVLPPRADHLHPGQLGTGWGQGLPECRNRRRARGARREGPRPRGELLAARRTVTVCWPGRRQAVFRRLLSPPPATPASRRHPRHRDRLLHVASQPHAAPRGRNRGGTGPVGLDRMGNPRVPGRRDGQDIRTHLDGDWRRGAPAHAQ
jgi:hypothetical protein